MEEFFLLQIGPVKVRKNSQNAQPHVVGSLQPNWKNCMHFFKAKENQERMSGKNFSVVAIQWVLDSRASHHMTSNPHIIQNLTQLTRPIFITGPSGEILVIEQAGTVVISPNLILKNVSYSPKLNWNLISIQQLNKDMKCLITYGENFCLIQDPISKKLIGAGDLRNGVYCLKNADRGSIFEAMHKEEAVLWLQRLGRPSYGSLFTVSTKHGFELSKEFHECCDVCHRAKQTRTSFPISN